MKLILKKFGAAWCPPCVAMKRAGTLEKFAARHDDVRVEVHDDTENGSKRFEALADEWKVKNLPTIVWTYDGAELFRSSDVTLTGIEQQYTRAKRKAGVE